MALVCQRSAAYGGAVATFSAGSGSAPTGAITAVDAALVAAGWTSLGGNNYSSPGESGRDPWFLRLGAGFATATTAASAGGTNTPFFIMRPCQFFGATSYNELGGIRDSADSTLASLNVDRGSLAIFGVGTIEFCIVADLDGVFIAWKDNSANGYQIQATFNVGATRPRGTLGNLITTGAIASGSARTYVNVGVDVNPITLGYRIGDVVGVIAQNAPASGRLLDCWATRIVDLDSASVTLEAVPGNSIAVAAGALIGHDPQPIYTTVGLVTASSRGVWWHGASNGGPSFGMTAVPSKSVLQSRSGVVVGPTNMHADQCVFINWNPGVGGAVGPGFFMAASLSSWVWPQRLELDPDNCTGYEFFDGGWIGDDTNSGQGGSLLRGRMPPRIVAGTLTRAVTLGQKFRHALGRAGSFAGTEWVSVGATSGASPTLIGPCGAGSGGAGPGTGILIVDPSKGYDAGLEITEILDANPGVSSDEQIELVLTPADERFAVEGDDAFIGNLDLIDSHAASSADDGEVLAIDSAYPGDSASAVPNVPPVLPNFNPGLV